MSKAGTLQVRSAVHAELRGSYKRAEQGAAQNVSATLGSATSIYSETSHLATGMKGFFATRQYARSPKQQSSRQEPQPPRLRRMHGL